MPINKEKSSDNITKIVTPSIPAIIGNNDTNPIDYNEQIFRIEKRILYEYDLVRYSWKMSGITFLSGITMTVIAYFTGEETKLFSPMLFIFSTFLAALPWKDSVSRKSRLDFLNESKTKYEGFIKKNITKSDEVEIHKLGEVKKRVDSLYDQTLGL